MSDKKSFGDKVLEIYFKEISRYEILPPDEIDALVLKAQKGDKVAKEKVVHSLLRMVVSIAMKYRDYGVPVQDLINEGNLGLLKAIDKFDPSKGVHFIGYAPYWIKQAITRALDEQSTTVRIPSEHRAALRKIKRVKEELGYRKGGIKDEEIAKMTGLPLEEIKFAKSIISQELSLDHLPLEGEEKSSWEEILDQKSLPSPEVEFAEEKKKLKIREILSTLSLRERLIIYLYTGTEFSCYEILKIVKDYVKMMGYDVNPKQVIVDTIHRIINESLDEKTKLGRISVKYLEILKKTNDLDLWKKLAENKNLIKSIFSSDRIDLREAVLIHRYWKYIEDEVERKKIFLKWLKEIFPNEREKRNVFLLYYALDSGFPQILEVIGDLLHISRERVRQIKERTMKELQKIFKREKIEI
ncbi:MAG: sigma-70 family RNA polymerase sigma factor [Candidatus Hydrothermales bacterium]